jgi:hypothetical protein
MEFLVGVKPLEEMLAWTALPGRSSRGWKARWVVGNARKKRAAPGQAPSEVPTSTRRPLDSEAAVWARPRNVLITASRYAGNEKAVTRSRYAASSLGSAWRSLAIRSGSSGSPSCGVPWPPPCQEERLLPTRRPKRARARSNRALSMLARNSCRSGSENPKTLASATAKSQEGTRSSFSRCDM